MVIPDLTPIQWAILVVLLLLAMAGMYYVYTLLRGYRSLPLKTTNCPGGEPHHLVYVDDYELGELAKIAKHNGKPCHGVRSFPPVRRRRKHWRERQAEAEDGGDPRDNHAVCNDNPESEIRCERLCDGKNDAIMMTEIDEGDGACWGNKCLGETTIDREYERQLNQLIDELRWDDRARDPETGLVDERRLDDIYEDMIYNGRPLKNPFNRVPTRYNEEVDYPGCDRSRV